jgi:hypothetical protein
MHYLRTREGFFVLCLTVMDWEDEMKIAVQRVPPQPRPPLAAVDGLMTPRLPDYNDSDSDKSQPNATATT